MVSLIIFELTSPCAGHLEHAYSIAQRIQRIEVMQAVDRVLGLSVLTVSINGHDPWMLGLATSVQAQPSSFSAIPECQIFVMWLILSPVNCIT